MILIIVSGLRKEKQGPSAFFHQTVSEGGRPGTQHAALGQLPALVFALNRPTLPASVTSPGAGHPGACDPLGTRC